jgi:hypothetical protein
MRMLYAIALGGAIRCPHRLGLGRLVMTDQQALVYIQPNGLL